ncbi:MAG: hypothetical protein ACFFCW_17350 [Candidatus Hodarchaeota archaeon]
MSPNTINDTRVPANKTHEVQGICRRVGEKREKTPAAIGMIRRRIWLG